MDMTQIESTEPISSLPDPRWRIIRSHLGTSPGRWYVQRPDKSYCDGHELHASAVTCMLAEWERMTNGRITRF
jgi:hypothetical protein